MVDKVARSDVAKAHDRIDTLSREIGSATTSAALAAQAVESHIKECVEHRIEMREQVSGIGRKLWALVVVSLAALLTAILNLIAKQA